MPLHYYAEARTLFYSFLAYFIAEFY